MKIYSVLATIFMVFTGVMLAGLVGLAYVELIYIPGQTPGSVTSSEGLCQFALATAVGFGASLFFAHAPDHVS